MGTVIIEFSPTGGTRKAARIVAEAWGGNATTIDLTNPKRDFSSCEIAADDKVIIAMPAFEGTAPQVALDRLGQIRGNGAECTLLCAYGNRAFEHALIDMEEVAKSCGFIVVAGIAAVTEHSILRQFGTGRPDAEDVEKLHAFAAKIAEKDGGEVSMPGSPSIKKDGDGDASLLLPKPTRACTKCGACARICPVGAIDPVSFQADPKKCISCMRCVAKCPTSSRKVNGAVLKAAGLMMRKSLSGRKEPELFI